MKTKQYKITNLSRVLTIIIDMYNNNSIDNK